MAQQNVFLGLPLLLLAEEVVLLVEDGESLLFCPPPTGTSDLVSYLTLGHAALVDDAGSNMRYATRDQLTQWDESRSADVRAQQEAAASSQAITGVPKGPDNSEAASKKRQVREAKKAAAAAAKASLLAAETLNEPAALDDISQLLTTEEAHPDAADETVADSVEPQASSTSPPLPMHTVTIPATSSSLPWLSSLTLSAPVPSSSLYPTSNFVHSTLASATEARIWNYPSTLEERARCAVFRSLHKQGYWMGGGLKFGGDWLVYPGS